MEAEMEFMQSVGVGLLEVVMVEEEELVGGGAAEIWAEEAVTVASGETVAVMVSFKFDGGDVVSVTNETEVTQQVEVTKVEPSLASVTEFVVVDKPDGIFDMPVEGE